MNTNTNDIDLIERFFDSRLTDHETTILNDRLKNEPELKKLFDHETLLIKAIRFESAKNDLKYLRQLEETIDRRGMRSFKMNWPYFAAAACVVLVVEAWFLIPMMNQSPQDLYAAYFEPYPNTFEPTLRGDAPSDRRAEAFRAYEEQEYQKASTLFTELLKDNKDPGMLLLLGNSNLILDKNKHASENFSTLLTEFDELDIQAKWFLSLCYLKTGEVEKAQALHRELGDTEIQYATRAKELLKKVD